MVNEIAPRPHNSGHYTIEAVPHMSQYKAQLCSILDEPIPETLEPQVSSSIMINILGGAHPDSHLKLVEQAKRMYSPGKAVYPHLYGKESKPSRKIGHITLTGSGSIQELEEYAQPLIQIADDIRKERLEASSQALRPTEAPKAAPKAAPAKGAALVLVTMGSDSDLPVLKAGIDILNQFGVPWTVDITSAHRTPAKMAEVATNAASQGIKVIIAAAGGAAHLPGMIAAYTPLPVIGIPVKATHLDGLDSLLSIVQMPVCVFPSFSLRQRQGLALLNQVTTERRAHGDRGHQQFHQRGASSRSIPRRLHPGLLREDEELPARYGETSARQGQSS